MNKLAFFLLFFINLNLYSTEFVLFTQPKTATHLLLPILEELTQKRCYWALEYTKEAPELTESVEEAIQNPEHYLYNLNKAPWTLLQMNKTWKTNEEKNAFLHLHVPYSTAMEKYLAEKNCVTFFVKRDPRDQIVSLFNHYKHINFNDKELESIPTDDELLLAMIRKESKKNTQHFMAWISSPVCCVLDFEKLMGAHGGKATRQDALQEIRKITTALQLNPSHSELKDLYKRHFGHGWSFFKGKVGVWKSYFSEIHKEAIKEEIGDLLIQLEYEKDLDW